MQKKKLFSKEVNVEHTLPRIVINEGEADSATVSVYWGCEGDDAAPARDVLLV